LINITQGSKRKVPLSWRFHCRMVYASLAH